MRENGTDAFNNWIAFSFETPHGLRRAYVNDGGWLGWRPFFTGSNRTLLQALRCAAVTSSAEPRTVD